MTRLEPRNGVEDIKRIALSKLTNWAHNYRAGDIPSIILSLQTFGFNNVLGVADGVVYVGNQRLTALKELHQLDHTRPPDGITRKGRTRDWLIPCRDLSHLDENQLKAYAIADNRTHDRGAEDSAQLAKLLSDLAAFPDLEFATGYTDGDIMELINSLGGENPKGVEDDNQGKLDTENGIIQCPNCGEEFKP